MSYPSAIDTFTDVKKYGDTITETITVPSSGVAIVVNTTYPILDQLTVPGYTVTTIPPTTGYYRPYFKTTQIEFGPQGASSNVTITYRTWGTRMVDLPIQGMIDAIINIEETLGLNPQGSYNTVAERLAAIVAAGSHQHKYEDLTSQIDGTRYTFTLAEIPTYLSATQVIFNGNSLKWDTDYILDGASITFLDPTQRPVVGETLGVYYVK